MPAKSCLFCPSTKLTKEHLWPDWLVTEFKRLAPPKRGRYTGTHQSPDGRIIKFQSANIEAKKRLVCQPCNNEWMSDIEGAAIQTLRPLIRNQRGLSEFDPDEIQALTTWVTLRSMVFDGTVKPDQRHYSASLRGAFARNPSAPPQNTNIWLAVYGGESHSAKYVVTNRIFSETDSIHVLTCVIHHLAIKVVTWKGQDRVPSSASLAQWGVVMRRIWPYIRRSVYWPPKIQIPRTGFNKFKSWPGIGPPQGQR
jgi:hypothetical protein